ncbi:MAG: hypothetical protein NTV02_02245 [Candidatus Zambryskibacteria bacterium]|nr:hypothetical protein [Candidatus Zambryskibacteria bacterium]
MFHLLEKLRSQSKAQRNFISFVLALLFTGSIFIFWLLSGDVTKENQQVEKNITANTPSDSLVKNMRDLWGGVVGATNDFKEGVKRVDFSSTVEYDNTQQ